MNKRIEKVRDDIRLTENKIRELNEYLKTLKTKEKRLCDEEILKTMRQMAGKGGDVMEVLKQLQGGEISESSGQEDKTLRETKEHEQHKATDDEFDIENVEEAINEEE